jgi:hypothetical protein
MDQGPMERRSLLAFDLQGKGVTVNANQSSQWEQPTRLAINDESSVRVPNKPEIVISSEQATWMKEEHRAEICASQFYSVFYWLITRRIM